MNDAIKLAIDALEAACGNRCNAEYNPCQAREAIAALRAQPESIHYPRPTEKDDTEYGVDYFTKSDMDDMWKQGYRHGAWAQPGHHIL